MTPAVESSEFTGRIPDIEFMPVYPGAIESTEHPYRHSYDEDDLVYTVPASITEVLQFYAQELQKYNWQALYRPLPISGSEARNERAMYMWNDPAGSPWHMALDIGVSFDTESVTWVQLTYHRSPDTGKNLPTYPGATNITAMCSENFVIQLDKADESYRATVHKSYVTQASEEQIAQYYETVLPQYGWRSVGEATYGSRTYWPPIELTFGTTLKSLPPAYIAGEQRLASWSR